MEEKPCPPRVSFSYVPGHNEGVDFTERFAFWDSPNTISWFKFHGYTLYQRREPDSSETFPAGAVLPFEPCTDTRVLYPYAHYDSAEGSDEDIWLRGENETGKVAYAQDSLGRHVVIKLVRDETDEYRILRFLSKQNMDTLRENCVIPVLNLLPIEGFWFAVMPRWGTAVDIPNPNYLHEATTMMRSILKGLAFLHENGIVHHDILMRNVLVNHFTDAMHFGFLTNGNNRRRELRSTGNLLYALFDFDHSVLVPPGTKKGEFRLPYQRSWGNFNCSNDTAAGEFDYDPFLFDVGMVGVEFCRHYQHLTARFPRLAPLLDMMTTWELNRRFTASEALHFLEEAISELDEEGLERPIMTRGAVGYFYNNYDRWAALNPHFVSKWKDYRTPPLPWTMRILRQACETYPWLGYVIPWTRWFFFQFSVAPRRTIQWLSNLYAQRIVPLVSYRPTIIQGFSIPHSLFSWWLPSRKAVSSD